MRRFVKLNRVEQLRSLRQLRRANDEALEARKDAANALALKNGKATWNSQDQRWEYPINRFDGLHDND